LLRNKRLIATTGNYSLTGNNAVLTYTPLVGSYTLTCLTGAYTLAGNSANLVYSGLSQPSGGKGFEIVGRTSLKDVIKKQQQLRGDYPADEIIATPIQAVKVINSLAKDSVNQPFVANTAALETLKTQLEASSIKWRDYYAELLEAQRSQYLTEAIRQAQYSQAMQDSVLLEMQRLEAERLQTQDEEMAILALMLEI
jgi:hypothetical protein